MADMYLPLQKAKIIKVKLRQKSAHAPDSGLNSASRPSVPSVKQVNYTSFQQTNSPNRGASGMRSNSKVSNQSRNPNKQTLESHNEYFTKTTNHNESLKKIQLLNQKNMLPNMRKSDMIKVTQSVTALPKVN
jgi:hypothetical protein